MTEGQKGSHTPSYACRPLTSRAVLVIKGDDGERRVALGERACWVLGRNPAQCDIPVEIRTASRVHCCLAHDEEGNVHLVDLNSGHGEWMQRRWRAGAGGLAGGSDGSAGLARPLPLLHVVVRAKPARGNLHGRHECKQSACQHLSSPPPPLCPASHCALQAPSWTAWSWARRACPWT